MLYIIRHGKTELNQKNRLQGRSDQPLNNDGLRQAAEAGKWLRSRGIMVDKIYSSPLARAIQTAKLLMDPKTKNGRDDQVVPDNRLIEMDYGPYEGMDLSAPAPEILEFFSDFANVPAPEGMEPLNAVVGRLGDFLEEIREEARYCNVLISTHAIAMKGALEYLTPGSNGSYWSKYIANCSIYKVKIKDGKYGIPEEIYTGQTRNADL